MPDLLDALTGSLNGTGQPKPKAARARPDEEERKAVDAVEGGPLAAVPAEDQQGMDALVAAISGIALLGLPVKGAVTTAAVGSKL